MTTADIRHKLYDYISTAEDRKVKAIYILLEKEIEKNNDYWNDKDFINELSKRSTELKEGKVKGIPFKEIPHKKI
jgi:hypothetical protein